MEEEYHTLELARLYEEQGHYSKALENYSFLLRHNRNNEKLSEAVERMKSKIKRENEGNEEKRIKELFEEWINLLILKKKLIMYETIQKDLLLP